jgi:FlaG/FlaF family flagellin (archaellin)
MTLRMKEEVAGDRLLGAFLAAAVVVVLAGWIATLVYLFGFRLF